MTDLPTWMLFVALFASGLFFGLGFWGAGLVVARLWEAWDAR